MLFANIVEIKLISEECKCESNSNSLSSAAIGGGNSSLFFGNCIHTVNKLGY